MSRKLLHYSCMELERYDNIEDDRFATYYDIDPVDILERGYNKALLDMQKLVGCAHRFLGNWSLMRTHNESLYRISKARQRRVW